MKAPLLQSVEITPVSFKLLKPFTTAAGQKTQTHNVGLRVRFTDGTYGVSEASSSIAMPGESQEAMSRVLKELAPEIRRQPLDPIRDLIAQCWRLQPYHPTAIAALECALLDAYTRWKGQSLADFFGGKTEIVESDFTLSVDTPAALQASAKAAARLGFRRLKVKLAGNNPALDIERLQAVQRGAPKALLVADGNQGFRLSQATTFVHLLNKTSVSLVFFEQPFPKHDYRTMRQFRSRCRIPLMADESCVTPEDALKLFECDAVDGVNIKVAKSGLLGALDIIRLAQRAKKRLAIGCMEESKVGLAASVHLACGTGAFEWIDLDSVFLLEKSKLRGGFTTKGPKLSIKGIQEGIGIA